MMKRLLPLPPHGRALCALAALALFALAPPSAALDPLDPFETAVYDAIHDVEAKPAPARTTIVPDPPAPIEKTVFDAIRDVEAETVSAFATERIDARPLDSRSTRTCAWRWLFAQQAPDGSWPGADPVVDTSLALLAFAAEPSCGSGVAESSDAVSAAVGFLASSIRDDGTFPVRDPEGDAARLPVLALRALAGITPHPGVLSLLRRTGTAPADYRREYFGEELAFRLPAVPSAERKALADADRRARRWETRTIPRRGGDGTDGPCLLLHWDEPPTAPFLAEDSPLPAAAFRPLPADASPEARALRATTRWLLVPVARSTHSWILRHGPAFATNAPAALFPDDVKVTVHRHAEVAEEESHAESAVFAELEPRAECAENAESGSPAGGAGEQSEPVGVSHADIPEARPDDLEEEGVRLLPVLTERFAEAGLEKIWTCWFVSRAPLYDGSFLRLSSGQGLDNTKNREWWMRMTAHAADPANPARDPAVADLFYGRTDGRPFVLEDYALANRGRTPKFRAWTEGDRFVVLRPYTPRDEDAVWDRFFEITTNVVRGPVFAP